jgi:hypothetical protein
MGTVRGIAASLMVVAQFNVMAAAVPPDETDAPLVVDPDGMLPPPVSLEGFEVIARWHPEILQASHRVDQKQLPNRTLQDISTDPARRFSCMEPRRPPIREALDHDDRNVPKTCTLHKARRTDFRYALPQAARFQSASPKPAPGLPGFMRISRESSTAACRCFTASR